MARITKTLPSHQELYQHYSCTALLLEDGGWYDEYDGCSDVIATSWIDEDNNIWVMYEKEPLVLYLDKLV